ncbi:MAG: hypothetical protein AAGF71_11575 [Pseudomonadota bacterium]
MLKHTHTQQTCDGATLRDTVQTHLAKVLASPPFQNTVRLSDFLRYVVRRTLEGDGDQLKSYAIGVDVFGKPEGFDAASDTSVRVQARKLRARLDLYYATEGAHDPVRIVIPRGTYRPSFEMRGAVQPVTLAEQSPVKLHVGRFQNISGDPRYDYLAQGFEDDIRAALAQFRDLSVLSQPDRADFMVSGTVRSVDTLVRVAVQVESRADGAVVYTEKFRQAFTAKSLFDVQEDIAARVAARVVTTNGVLLSTQASRGDRQDAALNAHQCRLELASYLNDPTLAANVSLVQRLEREIRELPDRSSPLAILSVLYGDDVRASFCQRSEKANIRLSLDAAERAVALDPRNAVAHYALFCAQYHAGNFAGYRAAAERTLELNQSMPDAMASIAFYEAFLGDLDVALERMLRAFDLVSQPPPWYFGQMAILRYLREEYELGLDAINRVSTPFYNIKAPCKLAILGQLGPSEALEYTRREVLSDLRTYMDCTQRNARFYRIPTKTRLHMMSGIVKAGIKSLF